MTDKFGEPVALPPGQVHCDLSDAGRGRRRRRRGDGELLDQAIAGRPIRGGSSTICAARSIEMDYDRLRWFVDEIASRTADERAGAGHRGADAGASIAAIRRATRSAARC